MDFNILYAIQGMHTPMLDQIVLAITKIMGSYGQIWLIVAIALLIFKKTRKAGICVLVPRPDSFSCPSTHTAWSFAAATAIFLYHKRAGIIAIVAAVIIGFTRLYLFVHFPTDVLIGLVMGIALAILSCKIIDSVEMKMKSKKQEVA